MAVPLLAVVNEPLDLDALATTVGVAAASGALGCGAVSCFSGLVRGQNAGRRVQHLDYEAYAPLAITVFAQIRDEIAAEWPGAVIGMHHRTGRVAVGETSVIVAAATAHRADAFAACRYAIERIKQIAPVWKREYFDGGDVWIEGATADPRDEQARQLARARACA